MTHLEHSVHGEMLDGDHCSLLQSPGRQAEASLSVSHQGLTGMRAHLLQIAAAGKDQPLSDGTKDILNMFLQHAKKLDEEMMITHGSDRDMLGDFASHPTCTASDATIVANYHSSASSSEELHSDCRAAEVVLKASMDANCSPFKSHGDAMNAMQSECPWNVPMVISDSVPFGVEVVGKFSEESVKKIQQLLADMSTANTLREQCEGSFTPYKNKVTDCKQKQLNFEIASCQWHSQASTTCSTLDTCHSVEKLNLAKACERVANNVKARKAQQIAMTQIECMVTELLSASADLSNCDDTDTDPDDKGSKWDITCPEAAADHECDRPLTSAPGTAEWADKFYKQQPWISEATNEVGKETSVANEIQQCVLTAAPAGCSLIKANAWCTSSADTRLLDTDSWQQCAEIVLQNGGVRFVYGGGFAHGYTNQRCYIEHTTSDECTEGWVHDETWDFYSCAEPAPLCAPEIFSELDGVLKDGWSDDTWGTWTPRHKEIHTSNPQIIDKMMHGPWDESLRTIERAWAVTGTQCTVAWTSYGLDSRDNEADRVFVNGVEIWQQKIKSQVGKLFDQTWTGDCDSDGDGKITVKWTSDIDQGLHDEGWGFNNVVITQDCSTGP